jgi:6-phosphogluconolactonase (cycloisomerase 2 family)
MKARSFSALFGVIVFMVVGIGGFLIGCASGHKQFAYVVGSGTNEAFEFRVQNSGALLPLGTPNFPVGSNPSSVAAHTSGDFLYIADFAGNDVTQLDINASSGNLSVPVTTSIVVPVNPPNIFATGTGPSSLAMSPTAPFLFVADQTSGDITAFTVDPGSGSLGTVAGSPFLIAPASNPKSLAVSPKGNFLYVANPTQGTVAGFAIGSNGALTSVGPPQSMGAGAVPNFVAVEHSGRFVYVVDTANNAVLGFAIQSNGTLAPINGSPFPAGASPLAIGIDPQGALLFVANNLSNNVSAFAIDNSSGALGAVSGSPFATGGVGPSGIAVDTDTSLVYVTEQGSHDIAAFSIGANGALKAITGSPFGVATAATTMTVVSR